MHLPDVAVQHYVLKGSGLSIEKAGVLHLNNQYVYDGQNIDLDSLFNFVDLTDPLFAQAQRIPGQLDDFKQILRSAIQAEKDSIVLYLGMKEMVPQKAGKDKIDAIIKEEMGHIRILAGKMIEAT